MRQPDKVKLRSNNHVSNIHLCNCQEALHNTELTVVKITSIESCLILKCFKLCYHDFHHNEFDFLDYK